MKIKSLNQSGFTLIEISIVLTIVALIVASITVAISLTSSARTIAITGELNELTNAIYAYKDKYGTYPGDTDGDDLVENTEALTAWTELADEEYIKGEYTGATISTDHGAGAVTSYGVIGENVPASSLDNTGFVFDYESSLWKDQTYMRTGRQIATTTSSATDLEGAAFTALDAHLIDKKIDDSLVFSGKIRSLNGNGTSGCYKNYVNNGSGNEPSGDYDIDNDSDLTCVIHYYFNNPYPK